MRLKPEGKQSSPASRIRARHFQCVLNRWFRKNRRELPWRKTRDPYSILISEIMLQQTQVATVVPYYNEWLRRFPDIDAVARARKTDILNAWEGLGYYSRAHNLHRCAKLIVRRFGGKLPRDPLELQSLPGIGRYTANAIGVFAFGQSLPIVETNTARVLARLFNIRDPIDSRSGRVKLWNASAGLTPRRGSRQFQSAMMDLGVLVCTARDPQCPLCPLKRFCKARSPRSLPIKSRRPPSLALTESHSFIVQSDAILLERCRDRWAGMWMLPLKRTPAKDPIHIARFPFTNHAVTLQIFRGRLRRLNSAQRWFPIRRLNKIPIPSPHRRAIDSILAASR
jgi:A/G-specific adenine glycosylase